MKSPLKIVLLLLLVAATSIGSFWAFSGGIKRMRLGSEVREQLLHCLPKTMVMAGKSYPLQDVLITDITGGEKGYELKVTIQWDGATTLTGAILQDDGFGQYNCQWNSLDWGSFSFSVPG